MGCWLLGWAGGGWAGLAGLGLTGLGLGVGVGVGAGVGVGLGLGLGMWAGGPETEIGFFENGKVVSGPDKGDQQQQAISMYFFLEGFGFGV